MEQDSFWGEGLVEKSKPSSKPAPQKDTQVKSDEKMSITSMSQTAVKEDSSSLHFAVLLNYVASEVRDLKRWMKFEEDKRLELASEKLALLENRTARIEKYLQSTLMPNMQELLDYVNNQITRENEEAEEDELDTTTEEEK